jgi:hypothetical protein
VSAAADPFVEALARRRRRRFVELGETLAIGAAVVALFAWVTSLDILRNAALIAAVLPVVPLGVGLLALRDRGDLGQALARGAAATAGAGLLVWLAFALDGLGIGSERRITELPAARVRVADIDARRHPGQETVLALLAEARTRPGPDTLRPLVPLLREEHLLLTDGEGRTRSAATAAREVLMANPSLLLRSLHDEVAAMAGILPHDGPVPPVVEIDVAGRLRTALGLLLELHVEHRMQRRFELPSVGVVLRTVVPDPEHGGREVRHEIGLTYPFAGIAARENATLDHATVMAVLDMVRADLGY